MHRVKNSPANAGDVGSIPGSGRSPGEGNGNPLQYSCLGNPMDRGAWKAIVHRVQKSFTRLQRLSSSIYTDTYKCVITHACTYLHTYVLYVLMHTWVFMISKHTRPYTIYTLHIRYAPAVSAVRQMRPGFLLWLTGGGSYI